MEYISILAKVLQLLQTNDFWKSAPLFEGWASWSEGFRHGEQRFPSTGRPLIWRLHQHKDSFLILYFCNKCVSTFWSCFRFLQASVLHQLKGEGHVVNLREQKTERSYQHRGPFQSFTAPYSPSVRSSREWGRSCTEGQNNLQAAPSATPSRHRRQTAQTNSERIESVTLFKDTHEMESSWRVVPAFPAPSPPGSACSGVCWRRWWETGNTITTGYFPVRTFPSESLKGTLPSSPRSACRGRDPAACRRRPSLLGRTNVSHRPSGVVFFMSTCTEVQRSFQRVLLENKMGLGLTKSPHHHSEKDRERQCGGLKPPL